MLQKLESQMRLEFCARILDPLTITSHPQFRSFSIAFTCIHHISHPVITVTIHQTVRPLAGHDEGQVTLTPHVGQVGFKSPLRLYTHTKYKYFFYLNATQSSQTVHEHIHTTHSDLGI